MGIASLRRLDSPDDRGGYDFAHYQEHLKVVQAIQSQLGITIDLPPMHPVGDHVEDWASAHQQLHDATNRALQTAGKDLSERAFQGEWADQNYFEHAAWNQILGT